MRVPLVKSAAALPALLLATTISAVSFHRRGVEVGPIIEDDDDFSLSSILPGAGADPINGWGEFDQLIDHNTPQLGTFKQRFWYGTQYWNGTGSPIILMNPGEQAADRFNATYTTKKRLTGLMAERMGAAVVVIEHRYWGESSPFKELTSENLKYLTLNNSIQDMNYFARNFKAPFDDAEGATAPDRVPWVFSGGSYTGALSGWIASTAPGTFWAFHSTSGVVQAVQDFWAMFVPVEEAMPRNCSRDVAAVVDYVDGVLVSGSAAQKDQLKAKFMLEGLTDADFGMALEYGPWTLQSTDFYSANKTLGGVGYNAFHRFCDYVENVWPGSTTTLAIPGEAGVGTHKAIEGYAKWFTEIALPGTCEGYGYPEWKGNYTTGCYQNQNASNPQYRDLRYNNTINRQWMWMLCNEPFGFWQDGAPKGRPSIVSRLVDEKYWMDQCELYFPGGDYGYARGRTVDALNAWTGGWSDLHIPRL
ncbi:endoprotease, partial [Magnaporthiopsis poae ATCC 64411]